MARPSWWRTTEALSRSFAVGGVAVALGLVLGHPAVVVLVAPLLLVGGLGLLRKPTTQPTVYTDVSYRSLHEGQGMRSPLDIGDDGDVEFVTRVCGRAPFVAVQPSDGVLGYLADDPVPLEISPRRWGQRVLGEEKIALVSPWGGYRWGPAYVPGRLIDVLPSAARFRSAGESPQPIGLIGAHRSRRDGNGSEFSSIRAFHTGDRLRRINWRVSLRHDTLHVESTRAEEDTAFLLIVDALADYGVSRGVDGDASSLDVTVRATAAIADQYLREGDRVSVRVLSPGGEYVGYGAGTRHLRRILGLLARVRPGIPPDVAVDQVDFRAAAGSVVVVLSPMLSEPLAVATARLVRRGLPVLVVDTLPPDAAPALSPGTEPRVAALAWRMRLLDREHVLTRLAAVGCPVVPWSGPRTLEEVMRRLARRAQLPRAGGA